MMGAGEETGHEADPRGGRLAQKQDLDGPRGPEKGCPEFEDDLEQGQGMKGLWALLRQVQEIAYEDHRELAQAREGLWIRLLEQVQEMEYEDHRERAQAMEHLLDHEPEVEPELEQLQREIG
jgi:hypothetical protein